MRHKENHCGAILIIFNYGFHRCYISLNIDKFSGLY